jgi:twitching motility two-component system response regulator PilG
VAFGKPEHAESGEAALALAAQKPFDLVFLDVLMPGMDGFTTCSKLHQTAANKTIPVIFVTSNDALDSRAPTSLPGGFGFIPKPVLSSQIILAALTLILRSRLAQSTLSHPLEATVCE